jgi:hypothetical protein
MARRSRAGHPTHHVIIARISFIECAMPQSIPRLSSIVGVLCAVLAAAFFVPFFPGMPVPGIDSSWIMAVNETIARGLVFGRDIIFTSGPLAPIYTGAYSPQTDWIGFWGSVLVALAVYGGYLVISLRSTRWLLIFLPFAAAAALLRDSIHYSLGIVVLLLAFRLTRPVGNRLFLPWTRAYVAAFLLMMAVLWMMPLEKGSFGVIVYGVSAVSVILLWRASHRAVAIAVPVIGLLVLVAAWTITGQPLVDLPHFFVAQKPIIAAYTDAMSITGDASGRRYWVLAAIVLMLFASRYILRRNGIDGVLCWLGIAGCMFIAFKAGFVRHDGHVWEATSFLFFASIAVALLSRLSVGFVIVVAVALVGTTVDNTVLPRTPSFYWEQLGAASAKLKAGVEARLHHRLPALYAESLAKIRTQFPLPLTTGSADVYSVNLSVLFAHGMKWSPRPGLQSYSAYDPVLDEADANHISGPRAPDTVFFNLEPIDNRLASLEDAMSWPILMSQYSVAQTSGGFLTMKRERTARMITYRNAVQIDTAKFGQVIEVPDMSMVSASVTVEASFKGRVMRTLYKLPEINARLTLSDGRIVTHRFVPSMAHQFMLSPYVNDTAGWVLAAAGLNNIRVKSIELITSDPSMYEPGIVFRFSELMMSPQRDLRAKILAQPLSAEGIPFNSSHHADCGIDSINGTPNPTLAQTAVSGGVLRLSGWAAPDGKAGVGPSNLWVALNSVFYRVHPSGREDVSKYFRHPEMNSPGISLTADTSGLTGQYVLRVFASDNKGAYECAQTARVFIK